MLLWLSLHGDRQPNPEEFTSSKESVVTGIRASTEETLNAVRNLAAHSLVTGVPVNELDYPLRIHLTDLGRIVVDDHDCDVNRWLRSQGGDHSDRSIHVTNSGQVAINSTGVVQVDAELRVVLDIDGLISAAHAVRSLLPQLDLAAEDVDEARRTADEIVEGAQSDHVDPSRLIAAGQRLLPILGRAGTAVAGAALADGLVLALHAAGI
jgi:hypothetical protein